MDFSILLYPLQFLLSFWSFSVFRLIWFVFLLVFVFALISRVFRRRFY